jgi:hypothetical protein
LWFLYPIQTFWHIFNWFWNTEEMHQSVFGQSYICNCEANLRWSLPPRRSDVPSCNRNWDKSVELFLACTTSASYHEDRSHNHP